MKTKKQLAKWYASQHADCGLVHYLGTNHEPTTEDNFVKWLLKKKKDELVELINNHSEEGQKFLNL